ncbi:hypothetical protein WMF01_44935 [Sorangium sp. So ce1667]
MLVNFVGRALSLEMKSVLTGEEARQSGVGRPLTQSEQLSLKRGGFSLEPPAGTEEDPIKVGEREYRTLIDGGLGTNDAAELLKVNPSRIRQRLAERTLYGIKRANEWRLPRFQFTESSLIPGIDVVIPKLSPSLHPVAVFRWFNNPNADLEIEDGRLVTPLDWLKTGRAASVVAELAELL